MIHKTIADYVGPNWDDFNLTMQQAEKTQVRYQKRAVTLLWLVRHDPAHLDTLLGRTDAGTAVFFALVLVCDKHAARIEGAVKKTLVKRQKGVPYGRAS